MGTRRQPPESEIQDSPSSRQSGGGGRFFDIMTAIFVVATVVLISGTILILNNPRVSFNPLPLADLPTRFQSPTPEPTFTPSITPSLTVTPFPPTATPTITMTPTVTLTPTPTVTNTQVIAGIDEAPIITPIVTLDGLGQPTQNTTNQNLTLTPPFNNLNGTPSPYPFIAREIRYEANTTDQGCQRLSIAGNVIGLNGEPLTDLLVEIVGDEFEALLYTGSNSLFGLSGFEIPVAFSPQVMNFSVRLTEQDIPLTDYISVTTGATCEENVVVIEFVQIRDY
jgi:hypothetical protein